MRVYFVNSDDVEEYIRVTDGALLLIGEDAHVEIDLVRELEGDDDILRRLSDYSRRKNATILCSIRARIYRREYLSVAVIDRGKILGISDATHESNDGAIYNLGSSYRVYKTALGYVGVIVGGDILYPEVIRAVSRQKSDYIIQLAGGINENRAKSLLSTLAYLNGISIISIANGRGIVVNSDGEISLYEDATHLNRDIAYDKNDYLVRHLRESIYDNIYIEGETRGE